MSFVVVTPRGAKFAPPEPQALDTDLPAAELEAEVAQRVRREVARLRDEAQALGRAEGERLGRDAAQAEAAQAQEAAITALREAWGQLAAPLKGKEHDLAELVTELSFALARHIVGVEVNANAESLKALVARLIRDAAAERGARQSIVVRLHPDDHVLLSPVTRIEDAHLLADATISRGGALVEIIAPEGDPIDKIEWDATIEARLEAVQAALTLPGGHASTGSAAF